MIMNVKSESFRDFLFKDILMSSTDVDDPEITAGDLYVLSQYQYNTVRVYSVHIIHIHRALRAILTSAAKSQFPVR